MITSFDLPYPGALRHCMWVVDDQIAVMHAVPPITALPERST